MSDDKLNSAVGFSVVIPLYNKERSVGHTLESVLSQTYADFEVLVVDDGSSDGSAEVVRQFTDPRIRLIQKTNGGVSSARNRGIEEARSEYIAFLDADDLWEPFYLEEQERMIRDFPEANMWSLAWGYLQNGQKIHLKHQPQQYRGYIDNYWTQAKGTNIFFVCVCVCRRSALLKIGGYDERMAYGEDLDVSYRMLLHGRAAFNSTICGMYYVLDAENRAMNKTIPLEKYLPYYIEKYTPERAANPDFRRFIDKTIISLLEPYLFVPDEKENVKKIVQIVGVNMLSRRYKIYVCVKKLYVRIKKVIVRICLM